MKPNLNIDASAVLVLAALAAVGVVAYKFWPENVKDKLAAAKDALDPTSTNNLAYKAANAVGELATGDTDFSLGGWIYGKTHKDKVGQMLATQADKDNPRSPYYEPKYENDVKYGNFLYTGANYLGTAIFGDGDWNLGGAAYELLNPDPMKKPYNSTILEQSRAKPAPIKSGGGGQFNGTGASGSW